MDQSRQEAEALWRAVFGPERHAEAAAVGDPSRLIERLFEQLPTVGYDRFTTPALSDGGLVWPTHSDASRRID